jgi:methylated-DNA-[protein]-cysteine S-methyltransferase
VTRSEKLIATGPATNGPATNGPASTELVSTVVSSPLGDLTLVAEDGGLVAVLWQGEAPTRVPVHHVVSTPTQAIRHPVLGAAARQLDEYFGGGRLQFDVPLAPRGTSFQVLAWRALAAIPFGETVSYTEQARRIGHPTAVRAVGAANGRNPLSIILPCHRVVGSNGALTGFAGGIVAKAALLDFEQRVAWGDPTPMPALPRER